MLRRGQGDAAAHLHPAHQEHAPSHILLHMPGPGRHTPIIMPRFEFVLYRAQRIGQCRAVIQTPIT
jgi:hypothetical protein